MTIFRKLLLAVSLCAVVGCEQLTGTQPASAACHGYAPYDSTYQLASGADTTVIVSREHRCGAPRQYP